MFANEWHWRPADVWALELREFCLMADLMDQIAEQHKKEAQQAKRRPRRGR